MILCHEAPLICWLFPVFPSSFPATERIEENTAYDPVSQGPEVSLDCPQTSFCNFIGVYLKYK